MVLHQMQISLVKNMINYTKPSHCCNACHICYSSQNCKANYFTFLECFKFSQCTDSVIKFSTKYEYLLLSFTLRMFTLIFQLEGVHYQKLGGGNLVNILFEKLQKL